MAVPDWAKKLRQKNQEIKEVKGNYYVYEVSSKHDADKKVSVKKTGKYLGKVTENEGFVPKGTRISASISRRFSVKEYGASNLILSLLKDEINLLQLHFPEYWKEIVSFCIFRLTFQSSFKQMAFHFESSYLSELYSSVKLEKSQITSILQVIGNDRETLVEVMKGLNGGSNIILIDNTHITTQSKLNLSAQMGYNSQRHYDPQVNLLLLFSQDQQMPLFYRCLQGSIREVRALKLTLLESGLKSALLVSDKGFYSENNVKELDAENWMYILPLRRNRKSLNYNDLETGNKKQLDGFFVYEKRIIWYKTYPVDDIQIEKRVVIFLDEALKVKESEDYLKRITEKHEGYTIEEFHEKQSKFGTISVLTNACETIQLADNQTVQKYMSPQKVFENLKNRNDIEQLNDTYKNVLEADRTYMQSDASMEAWHFINFLALRTYYKIFHMLKEKNLTKKYSPSDILLLLQTQRKIKINNEWVDSEIPKKTKDVLNLMFPIP